VKEVEMEDNYNLQNCGEDDVLSFGENTYKVGKFKKAINGAFGNNLGHQLNGQLGSYQGIKIDDSILAPKGVNEPYARWFGDGIDCEILNLGSKSWKKGKVRIKVSVEFYVEEQEDSQTLGSDALEISPPESPLDDLRQMINQGNQQ
jgi:hypothetical protein